MKLSPSLCKLELEGERNPSLFNVLWQKGGQIEDLCLLVKKQFLDPAETNVKNIDSNSPLDAFMRSKQALAEAEFYIAASLQKAPSSLSSGTASLLEVPALRTLLAEMKNLHEAMQLFAPAVKQQMAKTTALWMSLPFENQHFTPSGIKEIDKFIGWVKQNCPLWLDKVLEKGKDIYISDAPIPFIFSAKGDCILLFEVESHMLGLGSIKAVFLGWSCLRGELVAVIKNRSYITSPPKEKQWKAQNAFVRLIDEYQFLKVFKNETGIIPCLDLFAFRLQEVPEVFLIEPFHSPRNLASWIGEKLAFSSRFLPAFEVSIANSILKGLQAIHRAKIIHRSIKVENILAGEDPVPEAYIIDFEESAFENDLQKRSMRRPLIHFLPPEYCRVLLDPNATNEDLIRVNSYPYDVWALGIVFYQFFTCRLLPWIDMDKEEMKPLICKFPFSAWLDEEMHDHWALPLMKKMLDPDPHSRFDIDQSVELFKKLVTTQH